MFEVGGGGEIAKKLMGVLHKEFCCRQFLPKKITILNLHFRNKAVLLVWFCFEIIWWEWWLYAPSCWKCLCCWLELNFGAGENTLQFCLQTYELCDFVVLCFRLFNLSKICRITKSISSVLILYSRITFLIWSFSFRVSCNFSESEKLFAPSNSYQTGKKKQLDDFCFHLSCHFVPRSRLHIYEKGQLKIVVAS